MRATPLIVFIAVVFAAWNAIGTGAASSPRPSKKLYLRIADEVDANLQKEILDEWFPVAVDEQGGGFHENYWDSFIKQWDWITKYQIDHTNGGWRPTVRADGTPASLVKSDTWT